MKTLDLLKNYRSMSEKELQTVITDLRQKVSSQKIAAKLKEENNVAKLGILKKTLAQALTVITEKQNENAVKKGSED
jgi:ribosomal protein L29